MGRVNAPLKMYGMVNALYKAANNLENIWDGRCPICTKIGMEIMPHRHKILKSEKN